MIVFEKVRWKNFLSTGNAFSEVDLKGSPSTLVVGSNGAGKSTMLDAICFVLFILNLKMIPFFVHVTMVALMLKTDLSNTDHPPNLFHNMKFKYVMNVSG